MIVRRLATVARLHFSALAMVMPVAVGAAVPIEALAQAAFDGGQIEEIRVNGSQRIAPETVQSYMQVEPGDIFDPVKLDQALKNLYATGLFSDVTLKRDGSALIVNVVENPVINRIAFEGNTSLKNEQLETEISLRPRVVYTRTKVQQDVQKILEMYRRSGRFAASVEPKVIQLPQNRVDLVYEITEGETTRIEAINFLGNRVFSDSDLRDEISTSESAWYKFLSSSDSYDPDRVAFDRELLRRFYLSEGYADFQVLSTNVELNPDRSAFIITFSVSEGAQYSYGAIEITSGLKDLDPANLRPLLTTETGEVYDATQVEDSIEAITDAVGNLGYAFVDVRPRVNRDTEAKTIGLTYDIAEGPKVYVERIDIEGNVRTLDKVVRREFRLAEGDAFNASKLRRSRQRIENLGFFRSVSVENEPGTTPDKTIVKVEVEEQSTGDVTFGAGLSTDVGLLGNIQLRERNLLGKGQDLRLSFTLSGKNSEIDLSFTEPYFLDKRIAAGFDVFRTTRQQDESSYDEKRIGGGLRVGYDLTEHTRQVWRYTLEQREIKNVKSDAAFIIRSEAGKTIRSTVSHDLRWDLRNSRFDTRSGFSLRTNNQVTGLGGDVHALKNVFAGDYYITPFADITLNVGGEAGVLWGIGEDTRVSDRFFLGGNSFRGFERGGLGPRDRTSKDAVGGNYYYKGTAEVRFPLGLPEEYDIRGHVFADVGAAFGVDGNTTGIDSSSTPRVAVGPGISWRSPFGPLNLDFGYALKKEDFDKTEVLTFSFGTQF